MSRRFTGSQSGQDGMRFLDQDGNPDAHGVSEVRVTDGTMTPLGNGIINLTTGGGGGGTGPQGATGATGPAFLSVSDVSGNTGPYSGITTLKFDDTTGLDIAPTGANEVTISIGSHWYSILVDGQTTLTPSAAENIEFISGTGMQIITDNASSPVSIKWNATGGGGSTGPQGFTGATGPQGFTGATGPSGLKDSQVFKD